MGKVSVLIPCYNAEATLRPTLESVRWADEILVVDSFSTDGTLAICREYTERILQHEYLNSARQKNWAIPQCRHEWVLIVDSDETLEAGFSEEVRARLREDGPVIDGYRIPRKNFIYGRWLRHGGIYPDYQIRLFRRDKGRYETREVHAHVLLPGRVGTFNRHLLHNGFKDLRTWMNKTERYTHYELAELAKHGKKPSPLRLTLYPMLVFLKTYLWELGILEGYRGFLLAVLNSFYYFLVYARLHERRDASP